MEWWEGLLLGIFIVVVGGAAVAAVVDYATKMLEGVKAIKDLLESIDKKLDEYLRDQPK